ncbi:hypothetical protein [Flavobacterium sp. GCM10027622]|uniref:hypothetical protein n=1 Tax=unclassified Flavobacterium TaxID=196869 RepID=UPI00360CC074
MNLFRKCYTLISILKFSALLLSVINIYSYFQNGVQLFNDKIDPDSERFLYGKYIIFAMVLHTIFESISTINIFSYYAKKHHFLNYILGLISIAISLPLFYDFADDFDYFDGKVNPMSFLFPLVYFVCGIFDFIIAGKTIED